MCKMMASPEVFSFFLKKFFFRLLGGGGGEIKAKNDARLPVSVRHIL